MKYLVIALAVLLAACGGSPFQSTCANYGFEQGTPEFAGCLQRESISFQRSIDSMFQPGWDNAAPRHRTRYDGFGQIIPH